MPTGWSTTTANAILNAARGGTAFQITAHHVQLHSGDPGPNGTANVLNNGTRVVATFGAASGGAMVTTADLNYTNWQSGTTVPVYATSWSAAAGGAFQASGTVVVSGSPSQGATLTLSAGSVRVAQPVAS